MGKTIARRFRTVLRHIPGFRSLSRSSIAVAVTYYAATAAIAWVSWPWGLAMLATPFFIFALVDYAHTARRCTALATAAVAGILLLAGVALGLSAEGYRLKTQPPHPALAESTGTSVVLDTRTATPDATASPSPAPSPAATEPEGAAFVASKSGKTFHKSGCASARSIKPENRVVFESREQAVAAGYAPCKKCNP